MFKFLFLVPCLFQHYENSLIEDVKKEQEKQRKIAIKTMVKQKSINKQNKHEMTIDALEFELTMLVCILLLSEIFCLFV